MAMKQCISPCLQVKSVFILYSLTYRPRND